MSNEQLKPWEQLEPMSVPKFPIEIFPEYLKNYISALNRESDVPVDYLAGVALSIASACVGSKGDVKIGNRTQPLILQSILMGRSGTRKSTAFNLTEPYAQWVREQNEPIERDNRFVISDLEILEAKRRKAKTQEQRDALKKEIIEKENEKCFTFPRLLDSFTNEYLEQKAIETNGATTIITDEGDALNVLSGDLYSANKTPNIGVVLQGYDRKEHTAGRIGRGSFTFFSAVVICVAAQPGLVKKFTTTGSQVDRGLPQRFLYFAPDVDYNDMDPFKRKPCPEALKHRWSRTVTALLERSKRGEFVLNLDADSVVLCQEYEDRNNKKKCRMSDDTYIGWLDKAHDRAARIAGILTLLDNPDATTITADTMRKAIYFSEYYAAYMASYCFGILNDALPKPEKQLLDYIVNEQAKHTDGTVETVGNIWRIIKGYPRYGTKKKSNREQFEKDLLLLKREGYIQTVKIYTGKSGKPPEYIYVNPTYHK